MNDSKNKTSLKIFLLGHPKVIWGEKQINISRRAVRTLLYYLASQGKPVGRSTLTSTFWPEENEPKANANLRSLLGKLRNSLPNPELLLTQDNIVMLDFSRVETDQVKFETLYRELKNKPWHYPEDIPLPEPLKSSIHSALKTWSGSHFLEDTDIFSTFALDEWLTFTDLHLVTMRKRLCRRLADHYNASGEPVLAIRGLLELINYDKYNADMHFEILSLLLQSGQINEAKTHLSILKKQFEQMMGHPLPKNIKDLEAKLNQQEHETLIIDTPPWPYPFGMNTVMVGRLDELAALQQVCHKGGVAIIRGEGGIGKTRLAQELFKRTCRNARFLILKCNPNIFPLQFDAVIEMLNDQITEAEWLLLPNVWANILSLFVPKLTTIKPNIHTPTQMNIERDQRLIFEALANLFEVCARDKMIVLVIDDLQWADDVLLSALQFIQSRSFFSKRGSLIMTYQPLEETIKTKKFITGLKKLNQIETLDLKPLSEDEVRLLVDQIMPGTPSHELIQQLTLATAGNPFFIIETIRTLLDRQPENFHIPEGGDLHYQETFWY